MSQTVTVVQTTLMQRGGWPPAELEQQQQQADETLALVRGWLEAGQPPQLDGRCRRREPEGKAYHSQRGCIQLHDGVVYRRLRAPAGEAHGAPAAACCPAAAGAPCASPAGPPDRPRLGEGGALRETAKTLILLREAVALAWLLLRHL